MKIEIASLLRAVARGSNSGRTSEKHFSREAWTLEFPFEYFLKKRQSS